MMMDRFVNWFKDAISLQFAKEGLENLTDQGVKKIHDDIKRSIGYSDGQCYSCSKDDLKKQWRSVNFKCASKICDQWLKEIKSLCYNPKSVEWDNVDLSCLPVSPWECVKLFLPHGSQDVQCAKDADISAVMTLFLELQYFTNQIRNWNFCKEVKDLRNKVVHSGSCELSSEELDQDIEKIIQMLEDPKTLILNPNCQEAVRKIKQLRDGQLELFLNKELELKIINEKIKEFTHKLEKDCENIGKQVENLYSENHENKTSIACLQEENQTIKTELETKLADIDSLKSKTNSFLEFLRSAGLEECDLDQLSESEDKLKALGSRINRYQEQLIDHENRICNLEKQQHHLKRTMDDHLDDCSSGKRRKCEDTSPVRIQSKIDSKRRRAIAERKHNIFCLRQQMIKLYNFNIRTKLLPIGFRQNIRIPIEELYVKQQINIVDERGETIPAHRHRQQDTSKTKVRKVGDIIYRSDSTLCNNIFVQAESGLGKTTLCQYLVRLWCKAHTDSINGESDIDLIIMKDFPLLFYINLEEAEFDPSEGTEGQYASLIKKYWDLEINIKEFLLEEKCLIIADGLDKCKYGLPTRGRSNLSTILTTSRPWKLEALRNQIEEAQCDRMIEIEGLEKGSSVQLIDKVLQVLKDESTDKEPRYSHQFLKELKEKRLQAFLKTPMPLLQLLCEWYVNKSVGSSKYEIYSSLIHHQIQIYFDRKHKEDTNLLEPSHVCPFKRSCEGTSCGKLDIVFKKLFKLSFQAVTDENHEILSVVNHNKTAIGELSEDEIKICFEIGVLSQRKVHRQIFKLEKIYTFVGKLFDDYFAAIFLANELKIAPEDCFRRLVSDPDNVLKLWHMLVFIGGMNPVMFRQIVGSISSTIARLKRADREDGGKRLNSDTEQQLQELIYVVQEEGRYLDCHNKFCLRTLYLYRSKISFLANLFDFDFSMLSSITVSHCDKIDELTAVLEKIPATAPLVNLVCTLTHKGSTSSCDNISFDLTKHGQLESFEINHEFRKRHLSKCLFSPNMANLRHVSVSDMEMKCENFVNFLRSLPTNGVEVFLINVSVLCEAHQSPANIMREIRQSCTISENHGNDIDENRLELSWFHCKKNER